MTKEEIEKIKEIFYALIEVIEHSEDGNFYFNTTSVTFSFFLFFSHSFLIRVFH